MTSSEETLVKVLTETLKLTNGTMPVTLVLPDQETVDWMKKQAKGRKHVSLVSFRVETNPKYSTYPSVKK